MQYLARYKYHLSKSKSNSIQKTAFLMNLQLLKPKEGISYKKLEFINENRLKRIKNYILNHTDYQDLILHIEKILDDLSFGMPAEKFEFALQEIGLLLGFVSQRPDKEYKKGPDNLWCGVNGKYFFFECKNEVDDNRLEISNREAGQMDVHCGWFDEIYGTDVPVTRILIITTRKLSYQANFTHDVVIMRKGKLKLLKDNIKAFIKELKVYNIHDISDEKLQSFLTFHNLDLSNFSKDYTEEYKKGNN